MGFFRADDKPPADRYGTGFGMLVGGVLFGVTGVLLISALLNVWPAVDRSAKTSATPKDVELAWGLITLHLNKTTGLIVLAVVLGALGGYIHAVTSFVTFVGNRTFKASWGWWYVLRMFVGASLAVLLYFALRAGVIGVDNGGASNVDPYGVATLSGLAGLFSKQATDWLENIFDTAFKTRPGTGDDARKDKPSPALSITKITPPTVPHGEGARITVEGLGFLDGATVELDGEPQTTKWDSDTQLTTTLQPEALPQPAVRKVTVLNPGGARSEAKDLIVT